MVLPFRVAFELVAIEVHFPQSAGAVALRFIVEVRGFRVSTFAAGGHCFRANAISELDHGDKAVSAGAIPLLRSRIRTGSERSERSPGRGSEFDRDAGTGVVKGLYDVPGEPLEPVDIAPGRLPGSEIGLEFVGCRGQCLQQLFSGSGGDAILRGPASSASANAPANVLAPEDGQ